MMRWALALATALPCLVTPACHSTPRSTRLRVEDFEFVATEMAARLHASSLLDGRGPDSPPIIAALTKVENLSSDILSDGEKWYLMDRVFDSDSIDALRRSRNIRFVIPAEKLRLLNKALAPDEQTAARRAPTHTITARLRSLERSAGRDRTDLYDCQFTMTDLAGGEIVWTDSVALKRVARGRAYN